MNEPRVYQLVTYAPGFIKFRISGNLESDPAELIWADYNDGLWKLEINGEPSPLLFGPARTRRFTATSGDVVEMTYAGPLSRIWRR